MSALIVPCSTCSSVLSSVSSSFLARSGRQILGWSWIKHDSLGGTGVMGLARDLVRASSRNYTDESPIPLFSLVQRQGRPGFDLDFAKGQYVSRFRYVSFISCHASPLDWLTICIGIATSLGHQSALVIRLKRDTTADIFQSLPDLCNSPFSWSSPLCFNPSTQLPLDNSLLRIRKPRLLYSDQRLATDYMI
jgi:hypothetical protein